ncbi:MAG TPA: serine/threonine-protein kinase PknK, partial [Polyangium sp.]|nr:serine/threonine-protein kinase PknK [Polyangium sp.]
MQFGSEASVAEPFDGYTSVTPIYEGAETFVYRARQTDSGTPVVLKRTKNEYPSAREIARLRREFVILREIALENTPRALALEEHKRGLCLVMADIQQPTLREILEKEKLDLETILFIAIGVANLLAAVHSKRIIHKDLSPRNILVDLAEKKVFLIDFGISARLAHELNAPAAGRSIEGTPYYAAPEQTGRMNRGVDARADLYSLGVILYEMLVGKVPFDGEEVQDVIQGHLVRTATPPHTASSSIPLAVSDIVMKLLAKTPEERYQSDAGLAFDLAECLRRLYEHGAIEVFPLCTKDRAPELRRAQRLYGRERDIATLVEAFERARERGPELVLVSGYSGIGKSALVRELHKTISKHRGYFISGKFEQLARDVPFAPVFSALRELVREILAESFESVMLWKEKLLAALKGNGALLTDLIPELVFLLGPQPKVAELTPDQAKNRFELTLLDFLHAFADSTCPLVLFLDDLQWLDPASRKLLHLLLTDAFSEHLLIIGAYRDNEVEGGHPLLSLLAEIAEAGFRPTNIRLEPLGHEMVQRLVADTLTSQLDEIRDLGELCYEKTRGNPFFAHQFLVTLNERELLRFDTARGIWTWDIGTIRAANVTENVVELVIEGIKRLPAETQHILLLAASIGHSFDFASLVVIAEKNRRDVALAIWEAMKAGAVVSLDGDYRYLEVELDGHAGRDEDEPFQVRYRFVHDRVHQAAYQLLPEEQRPKLHLAIGRLLAKHSKDEQLLDLVHHLNIGAPAIEDHQEKLDLARKNIRAAERAMASTAYHAATAYTRAGMEMLGEDDWEDHYDLCRAMYLVAGKCAYLAGEPERTAAIFAELMRRAKTNVERAEIQRQQVYSLAANGRFHDAVRVVIDALAALGHPLSMEDIQSPQVLMAEVAQIQTNLRGRRIADVIDAPETKDPVIRAVLAILDSIGDGAHHLGPVAFSIINLRAVNIALVHGNTELVVNPYVCTGYMLAAIRGRVVEGMEFCKLAEAI